jgi:hypothetical protein
MKKTNRRIVESFEDFVGRVPGNPPSLHEKGILENIHSGDIREFETISEVLDVLEAGHIIKINCTNDFGDTNFEKGFKIMFFLKKGDSPTIQKIELGFCEVGSDPTQCRYIEYPIYSTHDYNSWVPHINNPNKFRMFLQDILTSMFYEFDYTAEGYNSIFPNKTNYKFTVMS